MKFNDEFIDIKVTNARINHIKDAVIKNELKKKEKFNLRVTRVLLDSGEDEWLISNLGFDEFSNNELKNLYNQRWNIETSFDTLKNALEIERITAKKRLTVEQDFYSQIVSYNLSQEVIKDVESDFDDKKKIL
jgi:IS4 transposase